MNHCLSEYFISLTLYLFQNMPCLTPSEFLSSALHFPNTYNFGTDICVSSQHTYMASSSMLVGMPVHMVWYDAPHTTHTDHCGSSSSNGAVGAMHILCTSAMHNLIVSAMPSGAPILPFTGVVFPSIRIKQHEGRVQEKIN